MDNIENRTIRVFISSTFKGMQEERNYLIKRTFPHLREIAAKRDVTLTELDLRWGITEEEAKNGKVVEICLKEIENSIPFFIGILGDRYGWIPGMKDISDSTIRRYDNVKDYLKREISVTEMEMQFGVLERPENMNAFFYIKEGDGIDLEEPEEYHDKLSELKKTVLNNNRYPVSTYSSSEDLADQVEKAFLELLDSLFPQGHISDIEKERIGQHSVLRQLCRNYIRNDSDFEILDKWINDREQSSLVISGDSGLGKSALIANWLKGKLTQPEREYNIIYYFIGNGGGESNKEEILKYLSAEIQRQYGFESTSKYDDIDFDELVARVSSEGRRPLLIVLDAVNQLADDNNTKLLRWIPRTDSKVKFLFSTLDTDRTMTVFRNRSYQQHTIRPMDPKKRIDLVRVYLKDFGKSLTDEQIALIVSDKKCENTLVLKTLLDELINFGIFEEVDNRINYYLSCNSIEEFYQAFLRSYEEEFGKQYISNVLSIISLSQHGLTEKEILSITEENKPLRWSEFYCSFIRNFTVKSGKIEFSHKYIHDAVESRYINTHKKWEDNRRFDILYHITQHNGIEYFYELPYQLYKIGSRETIQYLYNIISDPAVMATLYEKDTANAIAYWKCLIANGYSLDIYNGKAITSGNSGIDHDMTFVLLKLINLFGEHHLAVDIAESQLAFIQESGTGDKELIAKAYNDVANTYCEEMNQERFHKAFSYYIKVIELLDGTRSPELSNAYNGIAILSLRARRADFAVEFGTRALKLNLIRYGDQHQEVATSYNTLAQGYEMSGKWDKAKESYEAAISIMITLYGTSSDELASCYYNYASDSLKYKEYDNALMLITKGIETIENTFGREHNEYAYYIKLRDKIVGFIDS